MDNFQIAMTLDLKQFYASLESIEGMSQETVKELQAMFGKVQSVQIPFDGKKIQTELDKVVKGVAPVTTGMNRAAQTTQSLNYIMRDSPYFFQNFNMGMMAIGNNLNPFIDQMLRAKQETGSWKGALGTLASGLTGFGGVSFAFSTIVTAITAYSLATSGAKEKTKDLKKEVDELKVALEKASYDTLKRKEIEARIELLDTENKLAKEQTEEYVRLRDAKIRSQVPGDKIDKSLLGSEETKAELKAANDKLNLVTEYQGKLGLIGQQENRIAELREIRRGLRDENEIAKIDAQILALEKLYKVEKSKTDKLPEEIKFRREHLGLTNEMIRAEIALIDARIKNPNFSGDRVQELKNRIELQKLLTKGTREYIDTFDKQSNFKLKDNFVLNPVDIVPKPEAFKETNDELQRMLDLSDMITTSFNRAANAVTSAAVAGIYVFKQENSLLQIFINNLMRAAAEALTLKLITTGLNFIGGLFGFPFFGSAATGVAGMAGGTNSSLSNPGLSGVGVSSSASLNRSAGNSVVLQQVPIVLDTRVSGRDIHFVQRKEASFRRKYYGASD